MLGLAIAEELYDRFPDEAEGRLAKIRAHVVSRQSCAIVGKRLGLGELFAGNAGPVDPRTSSCAWPRTATCSPRSSRPASARSTSSTASSHPRPIVEAFQERIDYALEGHVDYKTELQEELARRGLSVTYSVVTVDGPPHDRSFTCAATIEGEVVGTGQGASKKAAEQVAAREALEKLAAEARCYGVLDQERGADRAAEVAERERRRWHRRAAGGRRRRRGAAASPWRSARRTARRAGFRGRRR